MGNLELEVTEETGLLIFSANNLFSWGKEEFCEGISLAEGLTTQLSLDIRDEFCGGISLLEEQLMLRLRFRLSALSKLHSTLLALLEGTPELTAAAFSLIFFSTGHTKAAGVIEVKFGLLARFKVANELKDGFGLALLAGCGFLGLFLK